MPNEKRTDVDWKQVKKDFERGVLSLGEIARRAAIARQTLTQRAEREGWIHGSQAAGQKEQPKAPELGECRALIERYSEITEKQHDMSTDQLKQMVITPDKLARAVRAAYQGAKGQLMADAAGLDEQTMRRAMQSDEGLRGLIREAHASHALGSLRALGAAQERGDAASARFLLEKGPYSAEYGGHSGPGGVQVSVVLNVGDPQLSGPVLDLGPAPEQG